MSYVTTICCDKTGVLPTNRMAVTQAFVSEKVWEIFQDRTRAREINIPKSVEEILAEGISVHSSYLSKLFVS